MDESVVCTLPSPSRATVSSLSTEEVTLEVQASFVWKVLYYEPISATNKLENGSFFGLEAQTVALLILFWSLGISIA